MPSPASHSGPSTAIPTAQVLARWRILRSELPAWLLDNEHPPLQWRLTRQALERAGQRPELLEPAAGLALAAWQRRPLDRRFLDVLEVLEGRCAVLRPRARTVAEAIRQGLRASPGMQDWEAARLDQSPGAAVEFLLARLAQAGHDQAQAWAWLAAGFEHCLQAGDRAGAAALTTAFRAALRPGPGDPPALLAARLDAEQELYLGTPERAEELILALDPEAWGWWRGAALACLARARGDHDQSGHDRAARLLAGLWRAFPWHLNLTLCLHDLLLPPRADPGLVDQQRVAVCIHSRNRAADLERTLASLAATDLGRAVVAVLDNGSTDATPQVIARAASCFVEGAFIPVRLPVDVGGPAARNWLLSLEPVRRAEAVAFLGDDVDVPGPWLVRLLGAAEHPGPGPAMAVGATGCLVLDQAAPRAVHTGEVHLLPSDMGERNFTDFEERLFPGTTSGTRDLGLWAYRRACASVAGRCHLLPRDSLEALGGFDARFSPTRFEDLERDLRGLAKGRSAVFDGLLTVPSRRRLDLPDVALARAQALGNKIKLEHLFTRDQVEAMLRRQGDMLGQDLEARVRALGPALKERGL